ncbi:MAG: bifunctional folylpolyglutamate synthase/dihydrofolate synthase [Verrucomicrobia bacterium]|nr:MAG: bifunctional folylpolyglutamate synthase/dihydrofolate synthase [Verrucomicrobiota bacterium]
MRLLAERLGHPERSFPVIHIAGTNGKGSVAAMVESILRRSGHRTGLFTSPHLVRQGERIQVDREILHEESIVEYTRELKPVADAMARVNPDDHPSFFEFMTAMAFLHFAREKVDVGVIEVGLGGRLDASNVVRPDVTAITSIGLDHCDILGDTIEKVSREKAGIIKQGVPVVLGPVSDDAEAVIRSACRERGSSLVTVEERFGLKVENYPETNLEGDYQRINAGTATLICEELEPSIPVSRDAIISGLESVVWPGRWQRLEVDGRTVILDAAHNVDAAAWMARNLARHVAETGRKPIVVVGCLGEERAAALLAVVAEHARDIYLVVPHQPRASGFGVLEGLVPDSFAGRCHRTTVGELFPAPGTCTIGRPGDSVVVTGSIYLLGEVLEKIEYAEPLNQGMLQDF